MLARARAMRASAARTGWRWSNHRPQARSDLIDRPCFIGSPSGSAGQRHQAAHRLNDEVVPRLVAARAGLAEPGDRTIDDAGIARVRPFRSQGRISSSVPGLKFSMTTSASAHNCATRARSSALRKSATMPRLPRLAGMVIGGLARLRHRSTVRSRAAPMARAIAVGAFDLDDIRAQIGEDLPAERPGQHARKFQHFQPRPAALRLRGLAASRPSSASGTS